MKRFLMTLMLMCALSTSIFAGDMPTGGKSEQPPPSLTGDMPTSGKSEVPPPGISSTLLNLILTIVSLR